MSSRETSPGSDAGGKGGDGLADRGWVEVQKKTFTNWVNDKLKGTEYRVEEITKDLGSGIVLITLLLVLAPGKKMPGKYKKNPRMDIHKRENLDIAFRFLSNVEKVPLVNIGVTDIYQGNLKLILGLIWALILRYQIAGPAPVAEEGSPAESREAKKKRVNAKNLLLDWVNASLPLDNVSNFTTNWNDGVRLSSLVNYCKPGLIPDHATLNPDKRLKNVSHAMDLAEKELGVPKVLSPEDLVVDKPDELSVMTYISGFCRPDSAGQNSLLEWVNSKIPNHPVSNFTTDWTDGTALAALIDALTEGDFPESELMKENDKYKNCQEAMGAAESLLGVDCKFAPEEFAENSMDQITRSTYITKFRHAKPPTHESLASQMKAVGPGITGDSVEKETSFVVRGPRIPQWANVDATVKGPDGSELPVRKQSTSSKATQFHYSPEVPGDYIIDVNLNSVPIPGSPFNLTHVPPTNVDGCVATGSGLSKARVGETAGFSVNCEQGGPGELQVDIESPSGNLESEIDQSANKNYNVNYTPMEAGDHIISVLWDKQNVPSSPFSCVVTDPKQCSVTGSGLSKGCIGEPQVFTVKTEKAGPGDVEIEVNGPSGPVYSDVKEVSKNVFNVTYIPKDIGIHHINVRYGNDAIPGSPFKVDVVAPADASKCTISNLPEGRLRAGNTYSFDVDASKAGSGEMTASAQGPSVPESCTVKDCGGDLYAVDFTPAEVGPLKVEVAYDGDKLPQFPIEFTTNDPTKVKVNRSAVESGSYHTSQHIEFVVSATHAGEGDLSASVLTPATEEPVELKDQGGKLYLFNYSPNEGGAHAINIKFDGTDIPDVPIRIFVDDSNLANNVVVTEPLASKMGAYLVETPYTYNVITTGAGQDDLEATSIGSNTGLRPTVKVSDDGNDQYSVVLNANEPDEYIVSIKWGGEHVPGSPWKLLVEGKPQPENVVCVGPVYNVGSSKPVTLDANAEKAGAGKLSATCRGNDVGEVPVDVVEHKPKNYNVSFSPPKNDIYSLNIMWLKSDVNDSPFKINLIPPDASKCVVVGPEVPLDPTEPILLHVNASEAGNGKIAAVALGDRTGEKDVTIEETKPNVFVLSFVPELTDFYTMEVMWGDSYVPGAPFRVNSSAANADKVIICEPPTAMLEAGQAIGICFDTSAGGKGILTATCKGDNIGKIPITLRQRSIAKDKYDVRFLPPEPDVYNVKVLWSGVDVKGSPFTINLMPVDVNKIKVIGPSMPHGPEGPVELMLQTAGAGKGKVTGTCNGNLVGPVEVVIKETSTDIYELCFIPPKPDIFNFAVQYGGQKLNGSPFLINTLPANASLVKVKEPDSIDLSKHLTYNVDATGAGSGNLTVMCHGEKQGPVKLTTNSEMTGYYDVSFTPQQADLYSVKMEWDNKEVPGSPFKVDLRPPMAKKVKFGELHIPEKIGGNNYVWLDLDCTGAGHGPLKAEAKGKAVGRMPVEADRLARAKYRMKFPPKEADIYTFAVAYGDEQVTGSPFKINLIPPNASEVKHTKTVLPELEGGPVSMFFDTENAGRGEMTADIKNEQTPEVTKKVEQVSFTEHKITFVPNVPDVYDVDVKWSGDPVDGSPFKVDTRPPLRPELIEYGKPIFSDINDPVSLSLNTYKAGPGKVTAKCIGPNDTEVDVEVVRPTIPSEDYKVSFLPKTHGKYDLFVFFDGKNVRGEPFPVDLTPVSEVCEEVVRESVEETFLIPAEFQQHEESMPEEKEESVAEPTLEIGAPFTLAVSMDEEMQGDKVTATVHGDSTGPHDIEVKKSDTDNTFKLFFSPTVPDRYTIDVAHNGSPVKDSPFIVNYIFPIDPSKCRIFGLQNIPHVPQVHEPICFGVDAKEAGNGKLSVTADGPSLEGEASVLDVKPSDKGEPEIYNITYVPTAMGKHRVFVLWSGDKIPGTPLTFEIGDVRKIQRFPYGKAVTMEITADSTKTGNLDAYAIHEESGTKSKVKLSKEKNGKFKIAFQPKQSGIYAIHVALKKIPIPGSPFRILYLGPSNPEGVIVSSFSSKGYVDCPYNFTVNAEDAGTGELAICVEGPEMVRDSDITYTPSEEGTSYNVCYIPRSPGEHQFLITWAGKPIPSGPFKADVTKDIAESKTVLQGEVTNIVEVGEPANVILTSSGPIIKPESISADCEGDRTGTTTGDISIQKIEGGEKYVVQFTPTVEDNYTLCVKHNNSHIRGSPFSIKAVKKETLSLDYAHPEEPQHCDIVAGTPVNIVRKIPELEDPPTVSVSGPYGSCPSTVTTDDNGGLGMQFVPPISGDYIVKAEDKEGSSISECPCKITVIGKPLDPTKVGVMDEDMAVFNAPMPFGKPARFRISTVDAGPGTLNITSKGPGKATVKVFDNKDGTYTCDFTPSIAGKYQIDILWNDNHIRGSPYMLHFKSKKEKVIAGLNLENESFRIDIPHRFKLHCGEIGEGILELNCKPPSAAHVRLTPLSVGKNSYQCEIVPKEVGNHEVIVLYNGKDILGSPFNVQFEARGDASKCVLVESSVTGQNTLQENVNFVISTEGAGAGKLTSSVEQTSSKSPLQVTITALTDSKYKVEFSPKEDEEYRLNIKYDNQHIPGSPFKLMFGGDTADAAQCSAEGDGIEACVIDKEATFTVSTVKPNQGELSITIYAGDKVLIPKIKGLGDTKTEVSYVADKAGKYNVSVKWAQEEIPGSPFLVECYNPSDPSRFTIEDPPSEVFLDSPLMFTVKSAAGRPLDGNLVVSAQSSQNAFFQGRVEDMEDDDSSYKCILDLPDLGKYLIYTRWSGSHIKNSPFKLKVVSPPKPKNVRAYGPGLENGFIGQEGNFTVETEDAGTGTLAVRVHGPKGAFKINMRRHPDNDRTILVRYDPNHIGKYTIDITWSEVNVPGSPFEVDFSQQ